jgi:hypothetical protein
MADARRKELERRRGAKRGVDAEGGEEEILAVSSSSSQERVTAAAAIQQPAVEREQQVRGISAVPPPPSECSPPSKATGSPSNAIGSPSKPNSAPSKRWFIGDLAPTNCLQRNPHPRGNVARSRRRLSSSTTETSPPTTRMLKIVPPNGVRTSLISEVCIKDIEDIVGEFSRLAEGEELPIYPIEFGLVEMTRGTIFLSPCT